MDMYWIRNLFIASFLLSFVAGRVLYSKRNKVKNVRADEQWLVDSVSITNIVMLLLHLFLACIALLLKIFDKKL